MNVNWKMIPLAVAASSLVASATSAGINLATPSQEVNVPYQGPQMEEVVIGHVPSDYYVKGSSVPTPDLTREATREIRRDRPVLDSAGQPIISQQVAHFSGKGTPEINWSSKQVTTPQLQGSSVSLEADVTRIPITNMVGKVPVTTWLITTNGHHVRYAPEIVDQPVGKVSYQQPEVNFRSTTNTGVWAAGGAVGGLIGGVVAALRGREDY